MSRALLGQLMDVQAGRMLVPRVPPMARGTAAPLVRDVAPPSGGPTRVLQILAGEPPLAVVTDLQPFVRESAVWVDALRPCSESDRGRRAMSRCLVLFSSRLCMPSGCAFCRS